MSVVEELARHFISIFDMYANISKVRPFSKDPQMASFSLASGVAHTFLLPSGYLNS